jgi:hypothetical protein
MCSVGDHLLLEIAPAAHSFTASGTCTLEFVKAVFVRGVDARCLINAMIQRDKCCLRLGRADGGTLPAAVNTFGAHAASGVSDARVARETKASAGHQDATVSPTAKPNRSCLIPQASEWRAGRSQRRRSWSPYKSRTTSRRRRVRSRNLSHRRTASADAARSLNSPRSFQPRADR